MGLRTKEGREKYEQAIAEGALANGCKLCEKESLKEFKHWRIMVNDFPYDLIAKAHNMIVPKRHVDEKGLLEEERRELEDIKNSYIHDEYAFMIEATHRKKSIPDHFHLHLIVSKN